MKNPNLEVNLDSSYYSRERTWPSLFSIKKCGSVLDIGCGRGTLGRFLKKNYSCHVTGIEIVESNLQYAREILDEVHLGNIEEMDIYQLGKKFDYIIFSDSLEHLLEPEKVLDKVKAILSHEGKILLSMPNVRNFRVTFPLLFADQWEYQNDGLLDRTHLRFFTESSLIRALNRQGLDVKDIRYNLPLSSKVGLLNLLTLGLFKRILTSHFYVEVCLKKS